MMNMNCIELNQILWYWAFIAMGTLLALLFINAPYGRYDQSKWGIAIPNKLGWIIMEVVSPIALSIYFWNGPNASQIGLICIYALWIFHYVYRSFIFPLMTQTSTKKIPIAIVLMAIFFNSINGFTNGFYLSNCAVHIDSNWFQTPQFIMGVILFFSGFFIHFTSDKMLIALRKNNTQEYSIPYGFLYQRISCPNYFGEILQWTGFTILTNSPAALVFLIWAIANLLPRAIANHRWYKSKFSDYPTDRKALIPYIL